MSKNVSIFSSSLTRPISHLIKISKVLHLHLFNSLSLTPALTMSYYICVFMLLFLSALSLSILSFPSLLSPFPSVSHTFLCPSVLTSIFMLLAPFLSISVCLCVFAELSLCTFPRLWQFLMPQLPLPTSSSSGALIPIMSCTFQSQVLTTRKPNPTKSATVVAVVAREMKGILMGVRSPGGFTAVTESVPSGLVSGCSVV